MSFQKHHAYEQTDSETGSMATGILRGLFSRATKDNGGKLQRISHITACVRSENSAERLRKLFQPFRERVQVVADGNTTAAASADVILLAHKPYQVQKVLGDQAMSEALHGKKIISILAGVTAGQLRSVLRPSSTTANTNFDLIRALPNIGASICESMTLISDPHDASPELIEFATWLFEQVGRVTQISEATYDVGTVLTGACYAMTTVAVDGLVDGAVQQGLTRPVAVQVAAQCFKGLARMLQEGGHPASIRESISSPGGATITGLVELERHGVRSAFSDAIIKATSHTKTMGKHQD